MPIRHLADADSLALLRFWTDVRAGQEIPEWTDISQLPVSLLPNIAITEHRPHPVFRYLGSENLRRWGGGVTGANPYEILNDEYVGYLRSLAADAIRAGKPVFSAATFSFPPAVSTTTTARLYAPFRFRGSSKPAVLVGLQIVEPEAVSAQFSQAAFHEELDRRLVADPAAVAINLQALHAPIRAGAPIHDAAVTAALARLSGSALVTLTRYARSTTHAGRRR